MRARSKPAVQLLLVLLFVLLQVRAGAARQMSPVASGLEAFFRGDIQNAIVLLKSHFFSTDEPDPWAVYTLGLLHRDGKGVKEDRVLACAYFSVAWAQFRRQAGLGSSYEQMAAHAVDTTCAALGRDEIDEMNHLLSCPHEGPPGSVATLGPQHWVVVERTQWKIAYEGEETIYPVDLPGCRSVVLPVAHTELAIPGVPPGDPRERRFLQYFVWVPTQIEGKPIKQLFWVVNEIRANSMSLAVREPLYAVEDGSYMTTETPGLEELARLGLTPSGDIEWTIATEPPRSGIIPIPFERSRGKP